MGFQSKIFVDHHCVLIDFDITLDCEECIFQTIEYRTDKSIREKRPSGPSDGKPTRVRTVLNEKQLHTLRWVQC